MQKFASKFQEAIRANLGVGYPVREDKLNVKNGVIHYFIYAQDGSKIQMTCDDNITNRNFVSWVQIHDAP